MKTSEEKKHLQMIWKHFLIRKDLEEFDAMVYEEGKLYERVLLQVVNTKISPKNVAWSETKS